MFGAEQQVLLGGRSNEEAAGEERSARLRLAPKRQDRQAIIASAVAVALILGLFGLFWLMA
jgi:hypothetical protein